MIKLDFNPPRGATPMSPDEDPPLSPFHAGEHSVQGRLGVRDIETWARKIVCSYLPEQHRAFHTAMPFLVVAARDEHGRPWATILAGHEGFVLRVDEANGIRRIRSVRDQRRQSDMQEPPARLI